MDLSREDFNKLKQLPFIKSIVVSDSMAPVINIGEKIVVEVGDFDLKRFDIVVIYAEGKLICHYVWKINKIIDPILIQTRNMRKEMDFPITKEDFLGKVVSQRLSLWQKIKLIF